MNFFQFYLQAWILTPILNELKKLEAKVSQLDDVVSGLKAQNTALTDAITALGTDLTDEIKRLQDLIASLQSNGATPANLADLASITTNLQGLVTTVGGLDTQAKGA